MARITIETNDEQAIKKILALAKETDTNVLKETSKKNGPEVVKMMNDIAKSGSLSSIKDPVAWQREIREDRKLPFRD